MSNLYHDRTFLNDEGHGGLAAVSVKVYTSKRKKHIWCEMAISDCYKSIDLDFNLQDEAARKRSINKIRRLKEVCARLEAFLEELEDTEDEELEDADD